MPGPCLCAFIHTWIKQQHKIGQQKRLFSWVQFRTSTLALLFRVSDREWDIPSSTSAPCAAWLPSIIGSLPDGDPGVLGAIPPIGEL
jgi:hypothetical protein